MGVFNKENGSAGSADDKSYIAELNHIEGPWNRYDFLLAANGYGWNYAISSAEYIAQADLKNIGTVSVTFSPEADPEELVGEYRACGESFGAMESLKNEGSDIGIGGVSRIVGGPVKIVWFNQTRLLRIFSPIDDEELFTRYAETLIRRTFGTADEMKLFR